VSLFMENNGLSKKLRGLTMSRVFLAAALAIAMSVAIVEADMLTPAQRAQAMLAQMTLTEKVAMLHGSPSEYVVCAPLRG
jgi:predicted MFS family arabinose efflux permease